MWPTRLGDFPFEKLPTRADFTGRSECNERDRAGTGSPSGNVCIARRDMNEDCFFAIPPEEVDLLVRWLREKKLEAEACARNPAAETIDVD
jgi:hypothetical protein